MWWKRKFNRGHNVIDIIERHYKDKGGQFTLTVMRRDLYELLMIMPKFSGEYYAISALYQGSVESAVYRGAIIIIQKPKKARK